MKNGILAIAALLLLFGQIFAAGTASASSHGGPPQHNDNDNGK